eukprot:Clim_evm89s108 gene=Clim_evmTU89s108
MDRWFESGTQNDDLPDKPPNAEEMLLIDSIAFTVFTTLMIFTFFTIYRFKHSKIPFVHESGMSILYGVIMGGIIAKLPGHMVQSRMIFDPQTFFFVLLPPIIFTAGYEMKRWHFFVNFGPILLYALFGTMISTAIIGLATYGIIVLALEDYGDTNIVDCMLFGALISATDPVTTLAIFSELDADITLYNLVFGESVLNDAVAIVVYSAFFRFKEALDEGHAEDRTIAQKIGYIAGSFLTNFLGAICIGVGTGMFTALLTKFSDLRKEPMLETAIFVTLSYMSFLIAQSAGISGIVCILFCGITNAHYTWHNLSKRSKSWTSDFFGLMNFLAENFIFSYMGLTLFAFPNHVYRPFLIFGSIVICIVARVFNIFPISFIINLRRKVGDRIPLNIQAMMTWSGLRGAIAFALAMNQTFNYGSDETEDMFLTTTLMIVLVTVIIFGGCTEEVMKALKIPMGCLPEDECEAVVDEAENVHSGGIYARYGSMTHNVSSLDLQRLLEQYQANDLPELDGIPENRMPLRSDSVRSETVPGQRHGIHITSPLQVWTLLDEQFLIPLLVSEHGKASHNELRQIRNETLARVNSRTWAGGEPSNRPPSARRVGFQAVSQTSGSTDSRTALRESDGGHLMTPTGPGSRPHQNYGTTGNTNGAREQRSSHSDDGWSIATSDDPRVDDFDHHHPNAHH